MKEPARALVVIALPHRDFDPSEVAVTWRILVDEGYRVSFATPDGLPAAADPMMLTGEGLDLWSRVPLLRSMKFLGLLLRANAELAPPTPACSTVRRFSHPASTPT